MRPVRHLEPVHALLESPDIGHAPCAIQQVREELSGQIDSLPLRHRSHAGFERPLQHARDDPPGIECSSTSAEPPDVSLVVGLGGSERLCGLNRYSGTE